MKPIQVRLTEEMVEELERILKDGVHANRSEMIRDAVRRFILDFKNSPEKMEVSKP